MTCGCIETVDAKLAEHNTRLAQPIMFGADQTVRLMIRTEEVAKVRGKRAVSMFASFCPFCGTAYDKAV